MAMPVWSHAGGLTLPEQSIILQRALRYILPASDGKRLEAQITLAHGLPAMDT